MPTRNYTADQLYDISQLSKKEQLAEQKYNKISEKIIGATPWGQFYGIMKAGADIGEGLLNHEVCIAPDGRILNVAKKKSGKVIQAFIRPAHEHATKAFSQKKWGRGIVGLVGFGWIPNLIEQKKASCFGITPEEFLSVSERRKNAGQDGQKGQRPQPSKKEIEKQLRKVIEVEQEKEKIARNIAISSYLVIGGIAIVAGFGIYALVKSKK